MYFYLRFTIFFFLILFSVLSCHPDDNLGKDLTIRNNSDDRVYYWHSKTSNFPDTLLPQEKPKYFKSVGAHNITVVTIQITKRSILKLQRDCFHSISLITPHKPKKNGI